MQRLFLLDGMALAYRAHFAFIRNPILNSNGVNASALFGFTNTLLAILEREQPTHLAVAFDTPAPTPRHKVFPEYKANREDMPEDLAAALPNLRRLCQAFHIPVLEMDGYEADDIIGTLARQADAHGDFETFMVTPDKDFGQLISEHSCMWKPGRRGNDHDIIDLPALRDLWGVEKPAQVTDILGLMGDSSDNIPGIPGVGEKTAKKLIAEWGSVEKLLENTDQLKGKLKERVEENAEKARLSKELATIMVDVPVPQSLDDLAVRERDDEAIKSLFTEFEFNTLGRRLFGDEFVAGRGAALATTDKEDGEDVVEAQLKTIADLQPNYQAVDTAPKRQELAKLLAQQESFSFSLETSSPGRFGAQILGLSVSWEDAAGYYATLPDREALELFRPALTGPAEKVGHNLKHDLAVLLDHGIEVAGPFFDTFLAHALASPDQRHSLEFLAQSILGYTPIKQSELIGMSTASSENSGGQGDLFEHAAATKQLETSEISVELLAPYAVEQADLARQLAAKLRPQLEEQGQQKVFYEIEGPVLPVLVAIEDEGIALDLEVLQECGNELQKRLDQLSESLVKQAGREFNLNSPKQLGEILFDEMKLVDKPRKTRTGQYKTDEQTLSELAPKHPFVAEILEYREASKLKSTYIDALPGFIAKRDGRIHTHFHQLVTATGRLASSDPNLQNIPVRTETGREIRKAFVPRGEEFTLLSADYSQIELRIMAAMSGDPGMIEAFEQDLDVHAATAAKVNGVALDEVEPAMRNTAKMVNFGIIYGISAFGLAQRLGIPRRDAADLIAIYFKQYPKVKAFMDATVAGAKQQGYVETLSGRRRFMRDINSGNATIRGNAERAAINTPIQGTAADMIKLAMIRVQDLLNDGGYQTKMLLQVHDELVFDLHLAEQDELVPKIVAAMQDALPLPNGVPIRVDAGTGSNWLEAH